MGNTPHNKSITFPHLFRQASQVCLSVYSRALLSPKPVSICEPQWEAQFALRGGYSLGNFISSPAVKGTKLTKTSVGMVCFVYAGSDCFALERFILLSKKHHTVNHVDVCVLIKYALCLPGDHGPFLRPKEKRISEFQICEQTLWVRPAMWNPCLFCSLKRIPDQVYQEDMHLWFKVSNTLN